ncbi:hypothetical protein [Paenibacillus apiarius]|uniref:Uncharacterized protein n=1 Tax=Paenibacillus apiarius TaxID=46240 RepID=A0ABT4E1H0_9BACL|nr:hypothetical protein [Paenibacillus apiarius]MCY9517752.1 hypothetical protein [Paenibacillus apiarius]MCY9523462.1 hypothetical protein [Paenibacillus apiarius]MCY9554960.1 hypothetical protein [Paenibacillus apiarius]MCY9561546.1 hypothetical protein [Paenibacillus apiarius]MCY9682220.1 hypothetical protein [Paenibacillus apiarius]
MKMWKQGLSLLTAAFLITTVLSAPAFAGYFPKNDEKSNHASNWVAGALPTGKAVIRATAGNIEAESKVGEVSPWRFNQLKGADSSIEVGLGLNNPIIREPLQGEKQYVVKDGSNIKVAHKYNDQYEMWLVFDHFGANKLHSFYEWRLSPNEGKEVSPDLNRASTVLQGEGSDWIGPYIVKANESGNANGQDFTGGNHNYDGGINSSPTARTVQYKVWADGVEVEDGQVIPNSKVTIQVVNYIQGYNTKQQDGSGREILKETVTYNIAGGQVQVNNDIEALEDVAIYKYYGLQTVNGAWNDEIRYYAGGKLVARSSAAGYSDSGTKAEHPDIDNYLLRSGKQEAGRHHLLAWLDRDYGLGKLQYLADQRPIVFTQDYGKTYFLQIVDTAPELKKGETFAWRGGYHFFSAKFNEKTIR